ncbi:MAG: AraC family transcriptional regulator [Treponema sp.]|jgi:AraC-like DNA-binding protein|nr:AraC family transcriptional regulator [Treponema sp.]
MIVKDTVYVYRLVGGDKLAWHGRYHTHGTADYELHLFLEGSGQFLLNRAKYTIEGNRLFLTKPREFHSILPGAVRRPITYYAILFEPEEQEDRELLTLMEGARGPLPVDGRERFLIEDLYHLKRERSREKQRAAEHLLLSLLFRWCGPAPAAIPAGGRTKTGKKGMNPAPGPALASAYRDPGGYVDRALGLMEKSVREKINIGELADRLGLSEEYFIRLFHRRLGISPFQYFTRLKIEAASSYLSGGRLSIQSVAEHFGFENPFHFSRVFKKCTGLAPVEYRRTFSGAGVSFGGLLG